eukprot:768025-Hanusia_phi.AAC.3
MKLTVCRLVQDMLPWAARSGARLRHATMVHLQHQRGGEDERGLIRYKEYETEGRGHGPGVDNPP